MYYTISDISKKINISPYTLRFYAKEGLLPFVERSESGTRMFKDSDFEWLFMIDCLKKTGMSIKDIKTFIEWVMQGDETIDQRLNMFQEQRKTVESQISQLQETLNVLRYKCWYYETAKSAGTTSVPKEMQEKDIPADIRYVREKSKKIHKLA
ncbi:transcriptional regulator, MerR family [Clostridium sp. DL-VIII]|uniref:MerR family transcriptional regulator n=1 Tax=Clostridium sp. DL-VIII TaxID=641107 RepID=UPI00023AF21C|nr:MerR family transcriptional regulator [Clostridium sp. DL-VIII]EHI97640.1 transcriptional regulator, MerR family [Clostridium sp. DL-VIII]